MLAHNETTSPIEIAGTTIPPVATRRLTLSPTSTGMFLDVPRSAVEAVTITTHVHDTMHDADSLGVDIPSIPETQFRRAIVLPGVPNDPRYRVLLRVYGYPGDNDILVRVRDDQTGQLLPTGANWFYHVTSPELTYLQVPIMTSAPSPSLRVEVTSLASTEPPIWAFITLTNNVTQSVTTITPTIGVAPVVPWQPWIQPGHYAHAGSCMTVTSGENGTATLNTGCGTAFIGSPINVDTDGHFEGGGTYQANGTLHPEAATFTGFVSFGSVAVTIRTATETLGPFTVNYNSTEPCASACH